jgi:hypothetical protein
MVGGTKLNQKAGSPELLSALQFSNFGPMSRQPTKAAIRPLLGTNLPLRIHVGDRRSFKHSLFSFASGWGEQQFALTCSVSRRRE